MTTTEPTWTFSRPERLPLPQPFEEAIPFFDALKIGELRLQQCAKCGQVSFPPRAMCSSCHTFEFVWVRASGRGIVYSFIVTRQPIHPALVGHTPFATVQVELEEGPIVVSNLMDVPPDDVHIGLPVTATFHRVNDEVTLLYFRRG
jgi:uncharacterized OB-fold protein